MSVTEKLELSGVVKRSLSVRGGGGSRDSCPPRPRRTLPLVVLTTRRPSVSGSQFSPTLSVRDPTTLNPRSRHVVLTLPVPRLLMGSLRGVLRGKGSGSPYSFSYLPSLGFPGLRSTGTGGNPPSLPTGRFLSSRRTQEKVTRRI